MEERRSPSVSRRAFLTALGAAAGGGAVLGAIDVLGLGDGGQTAAAARYDEPSPSDFALQGRANDQRVAVLGAGIAGLCCAYELDKAGYDVTVVEAADRIGGRNWTVRRGDVQIDRRGERQRCEFATGNWLNAGPARIAQHHTTLHYCRELGVAVEVFVNANVDAYVERDGVVLRRRSAIADLDGYTSELLAKCADDAALDGDLTDDERRALIAHLRAVGALGRSDRGYDEPAGVTTTGTIGEPDHLSTLLGLGLGDRLAFEKGWHQAMPMFHPVGGMDRIVDAFATALGVDRLRLGSPVAEVGATSDGITATLASGDTIEADWGVVALPPAIAAALPNPWDPATTRRLEIPAGVVTGKIGLEYDRRFWETHDHILGGTTTTHPDVRVIWYPSTDYLAEGGVIVGAYPFGPAEAASTP